MAGKRPRKFKPEFKLNVVLESYVTGNASATAARNGIHITQLTNWRKRLLRQGAKIFLSSKKKREDNQGQIGELEKIIGRITIENELLKKLKNY